MSVGVFPRTHGSAFFQRGETQSLVTCTLGTIKDEQIVDGSFSEYAEKFPPCTTTFPPSAPARRGASPARAAAEIGHGALASAACGRSCRIPLSSPTPSAW